MKKKILIIGAIVTGVLILLAGGFFVYLEISRVQPKEIIQTITETSTKKSDSLPRIMNFGINIEPYDKTTGMAGDVKFEKLSSPYWSSMMLEHFGYTMPQNENMQNPGLNVHPEFFLPAGTKIFAVSDGTVTDVPTLYSKDYSVMVTPDDSTEWIINYEHVWNPLVKKGDRIKAGQIIAEVSTLQMGSLDNRYGKWALMIFKGGNQTDGNLAYCPYLLFDESVKAEMQSKVTQFVKDWELFIGKNVYDEETWLAPGCKYEKMTETEAKNGKIN